MQPGPSELPGVEQAKQPEKPMSYHTKLLSFQLSLLTDKELFPQELDRLNKVAAREAQEYMEEMNEGVTKPEDQTYEEYHFHTEDDGRGGRRLIGTLTEERGGQGQVVDFSSDILSSFARHGNIPEDQQVHLTYLYNCLTEGLEDITNQVQQTGQYDSGHYNALSSSIDALNHIFAQSNNPELIEISSQRTPQLDTQRRWILGEREGVRSSKS